MDLYQRVLASVGSAGGGLAAAVVNAAQATPAESVLFWIGIVFFLLGVGGLLLEVIGWLRRRNSPKTPSEAHMFYADTGAEVDFSEVETSGYDGPRLGPKAKWTAEKSRFERGQQSVPRVKPPNRFLRLASRLRQLLGRVPRDPGSAERDLGASSGLERDAVALKKDPIAPDDTTGPDSKPGPEA